MVGITVSTWQTFAARKAQRETEVARSGEQQQRLAAQSAQKVAATEQQRADAQAVKATESQDAEEQNGAFLVLAENEYAPINRTVQPTTIDKFQ